LTQLREDLSKGEIRIDETPKVATNITCCTCGNTKCFEHTKFNGESKTKGLNVKAECLAKGHSKWIPKE
jgi:hypothetical protein